MINKRSSRLEIADKTVANTTTSTLLTTTTTTSLEQPPATRISQCAKPSTASTSSATATSGQFATSSGTAAAAPVGLTMDDFEAKKREAQKLLVQLTSDKMEKKFDVNNLSAQQAECIMQLQSIYNELSAAVQAAALATTCDTKTDDASMSVVPPTTTQTISQIEYLPGRVGGEANGVLFNFNPVFIYSGIFINNLRKKKS